MPELPDVTVYVETIAARTVGRTVERVRIASPFVVRSVDPPIYQIEGKQVRAVRRIGKRIAIGLDEDLWIVIHLMIAGRFRWLKPGAKIPGRLGLAAFDFDNGTLVLTEAGTQRRASITLIRAPGCSAGSAMLTRMKFFTARAFPQSSSHRVSAMTKSQTSTRRLVMF